MDVDAAPAGDAASWALAEAHNAPSDLKPLLERAAELLSRRLYYQLSSTLSDIIARPSSASLQVELYQRFISEVSGKLDPLALVGLAVRVARQYARPEEAVAFLEGVTERLDASKAPEARVMAVIETASYRLHLGQLDQTKLAIDQSSVVLDGLPSIEITVHASFYRVSGEYHKVRGAGGRTMLTAPGQGRVRRLLPRLAPLPGLRRRPQRPQRDRPRPPRARSGRVRPARDHHLQLRRARASLGMSGSDSAAHASHPRLVARDIARVASQAALRLQRGRDRQVRVVDAALPAGGASRAA